MKELIAAIVAAFAALSLNVARADEPLSECDVRKVVLDVSAIHPVARWIDGRPLLDRVLDRTQYQNKDSDDEVSTGGTVRIKSDQLPIHLDVDLIATKVLGGYMTNLKLGGFVLTEGYVLLDQKLDLKQRSSVELGRYRLSRGVDLVAYQTLGTRITASLKDGHSPQIDAILAPSAGVGLATRSNKGSKLRVGVYTGPAIAIGSSGIDFGGEISTGTVVEF